MLQEMLAKVTTGNEPGSPTLQPVESWKSITDVDVWWIKNKRKTACDSTEGWYGAMLLIWCYVVGMALHWPINKNQMSSK